MSSVEATPAFPQGDGLMANLIRQYDWSKTPLGPPSDWPKPLVTAVSIMVESGQPMFTVWGPERTLIYNDAYAEVLGLKHPRALGQPFHEVWSEIDHDLRPIMDRAFAGEPIHMADIRLVMHRRSFPEETHFAFSYSPLRDEDGSVGGVFCPCIETTQQVMAQRALAQREAELRSLTANTPAILTRFDRSFRHLFANEAAAEAVGLPMAEVVGKTSRELGMPPDLCDYWEGQIGKVFETGEGQVVHFEFDAEGGRRAFEGRVVPEFGDRPGEVARVLGVVHDVTARYTAEQALRQQNRQLQALYALSDAVHQAATVDQICDLALDHLLAATSADRASVLLFDTEDVMRFKAWRGLSADYRAAVDGHSPWTPDDVDAAPILVEDVSTDPELAPLRHVFVAENIRALAFIPLIGRRRVLGKFMMYFSEPHLLSDDELAICRTAAGSVATSLARSESADELRRERDLVRTIAENSTSALAMMDERGYCTYANRALLEMTGYSEEEMKSQPLHYLIHHHYPDGRPYPLEECPIDRALPENFDIREHDDVFFRKDGSSFPVMCAASPIFDEGRPVSTVVEIRDVTAEKEAEAAIRQSEQRFRTMADTAPAMLWVTDTDGRCTFLSRGWYDYTGQGKDDGLGFGWLDMVHPDDRDETRHKYLTSAESHRPFLLDFRLRTANGEYRWVLDQGQPRYDENGEWRGYIGSVIDVHDRKVAADALRESEQNLRELSASLEQRVAERTAELRRQTARLRNLAAELASTEQRERKRLAAILHDDVQQLLFATMIRLGGVQNQVPDGPLAELVDEATAHLREAISAARTLTHQLRPPALYEAGLVPALEWLASQTAQLHGLDVSVTNSSGSDVSDDARALLFECTRELLFNVVKYAGVDEARIEIDDDQHHLCVAVVDEGVGFDPDYVLKASQVGAFGLFSVRERLAALGGSVRVESAPGKGTRVELAVPLATEVQLDVPEEDLRVDGQGDGSATPPAEQSGSQIIRVLVVDDHAIVRQGLANIVDAHERIMVVGEAADGVEAVEAVQLRRPHVVLVDVNMPMMNGIEATREIRRRFPNTAVVGLSVQDDEATAKAMLAAGASSFVPKSGDSLRLIDAIIAAARLAREGSTARPEGNGDQPSLSDEWR